MKTTHNLQPAHERGIALITALLATMMLLALGIAIVHSTSTDTITTKTQRVGEQSFFVADAGIGIARRAIAQAFTEEIDKIRSGETAFYKNNPPVSATQFPDVQVVPTPDGTWNNAFYQRIRNRATQLVSVSARDQKLDQLNGSSFSVQYGPISGTVSLLTPSASQATEVVVLRYAIQVTGKTTSGGNAIVHETGRLSTNISLTANGDSNGRDFKFSGFGAFFDNGDTTANSALAAGTFSGPVHTNTHFSFNSGRNVTFRNVVSQVDNYIRYDSSSFTSGQRSIPTNNITGISLSAEGYKKTAPVPLPANNFSQEYAVINGTGITDVRANGLPVDPPAVVPTDNQGNPISVFDANGRVTNQTLGANLRNTSNQTPAISGNSALPNGVYVASSDGTNINGSGIYVQGDASDIQLYADTNGDQVYVIQQTQGNRTTTTTIRTSYANNTTTMTSGSSTYTYNGIFKDKSDPLNLKPGASLFVNGNINSLRGGRSGGTTKPAVASQTRLTITAQADITITGDLKYTDPVVNSDGTPVSNINAVQNVLGIFTNDGNANLAPNSSYVNGPGLSMELNAAIVTFNSNTGNDNGQIDGSITYTGNTNPGANDRWRLVGSRVQSKINNIGYSNRDIYFDVRFSGGRFSPPFFPGTSYDLGASSVPVTAAIAVVDAPTATAMSWFRDSN